MNMTVQEIMMTVLAMVMTFLWVRERQISKDLRSYLKTTRHELHLLSCKYEPYIDDGIN